MALVGVMLSRNVSKNHYGFVAITNAKLLLLLLLGGNLGNQRGGAGVLKCICNCIYRYSTAVQSCICICICKCNQICNGHLASQASVASVRPSLRLSVCPFVHPSGQSNGYHVAHGRDIYVFIKPPRPHPPPSLSLSTRLSTVQLQLNDVYLINK